MMQLQSESGASHSQVPLDPKEKKLMLERQQLAEAEKRDPEKMYLLRSVNQALIPLDD